MTDGLGLLNGSCLGGAFGVLTGVLTGVVVGIVLYSFQGRTYREKKLKKGEISLPLFF